MLRILVLSTLFPDSHRPRFGVFVERMAQELAKRDDVEVQVVAPIGIPLWPMNRIARFKALSALPRNENWNGLTVHRPRFSTIPGTGGYFNASSLKRAITPLLQTIRRDFAFDVIAAEFFYPDGPAAVELGKQYLVPVSIKSRGSDIEYWGRNHATAGQVRAAGRTADGLLAVSNALRDDMIELGMPSEKIQQISTGVDFDRFTPRDRQEMKTTLGFSGPVILSVGALVPRKGHDITVRAVATIPDAVLCIAGEGPERSALEALVEKLGMSARVKMLGNVSHETLADYLAAADIMALATQFEGIANAWIEALASGTPVVTTDVGGVRQAVQDPIAGRIVERTPQAFAGAITELLRNPLAPEQVKASVAPFTWAANSENHFAYFTKLVSEYKIKAR